MTRPGFRKGRPGGGRQPAAQGDGFLSSSLFSQAQILHLMKNEFARSRRHGIPMGVVLLQVDRLARLADFHGAGLRQSVKQAVAQLVREKTRGSDLLGTTNDDHYLLVMPHTDLDQARIVAERLHQLFGEVEVTVDGTPLVLTASIGITACDDQGTLFFDSILSQAESALEYAGQNGGDQVVSFGEASLRSDGPGSPGNSGSQGNSGSPGNSGNPGNSHGPDDPGGFGRSHGGDSSDRRAASGQDLPLGDDDFADDEAEDTSDSMGDRRKGHGDHD